LRVDLVAAGAGEGVAKKPPVLGGDLAVAVAEALEEPRRALDVGEKQRDGSGRQHRHACDLTSTRLAQAVSDSATVPPSRV
jgi:hypothetical protein